AYQNPHVRFALPQRVLRAAPLAYINESHNNAIDLVLDRTVRLEASQEPTAVLAAHLAFARTQIAHDPSRVSREVVVLEAMGEVGDRPTFVSRGYVEKLGNARRKAIDSQLRVEKENTDVRRRHQILHIAVSARHALQLGFQLTIDSLQFLIDR